MTLALALVCAGVAPGVAGAATSTHIDCSASPAGADGTIDHPFTSLADVPSPLGPGDEVLFKVNTTCVGNLHLTGSGTFANPIRINSYGQSATPQKPIISGTGADAITLDNASFIALIGLEVTNPGNGASTKRGVHVMADGQTASNVVIGSLDIHDVGGNLDKDGGGSGGIQVDSLNGGKFKDLNIGGNQISDVSRSGIFLVGTSAGTRPRAGQPWPEASTGVRIENNTITTIAGDGIVALGTDGASITGNDVSKGNLAGRGLADPQGLLCNAGIWAFNSNSTLIAGNVVHDMKFNGCDGTAFDIDYDQDGTIVTRNLSYGNEGGFILLCTDSQPRTATVSMNLSLDDGHLINSSPCSEPAGNYNGISIYNNTAYGPNPDFALLGNSGQKLYGPASLTFFNNIVDDSDGGGAGFECEPGCTNNLFWGTTPAGRNYLVEDPRFRDPAGSDLGKTAGGFRLGPDSPAFDAGAPLPSVPTYDFFSDSVMNADKPNIGFDLSAAHVTPVPGITFLKLSRHRFRPMTGTFLNVVRDLGLMPRPGARLRVGLHSHGTVHFLIQRLGAAKGKTRTVAVEPAPAGRTTFRVTGKGLSPGAFRLEVYESTGKTRSKAVTTTFHILPPRSPRRAVPRASGRKRGVRCAFVPAPPSDVRHLKRPAQTIRRGAPLVADVSTSCGSFRIRLATNKAPVTTNSFAYLARHGYYRRTSWYRIVSHFVIQGGDPSGIGTGGPGYQEVERPPRGLQYKRGVVAMSKTAAEPVGASGGTFFVVTARNAHLAPDYALLGRVVKGMAVVRKIGSLGRPSGVPKRPVVIRSVSIRRAGHDG